MPIDGAAAMAAKLSVISGLVLAAIFDARYRLIPNVTTLLVLVGGLGMRLLAAPTTVWLSLIVAFGVFVALMVIAGFRFMGAGDAKLISAVTLTEPVAGVIPLLLAIGIAGGVVALIFLLGGWFFGRRPAPAGPRHRPPNVLARFFKHQPIKRAVTQPIPYAAAVLGAVMWIGLWGEI